MTLPLKRNPKILNAERTLLIDLYRVTKGLLKDFEPDEIEPHEQRVVDVVHNYLNGAAARMSNQARVAREERPGFFNSLT